MTVSNFTVKGSMGPYPIYFREDAGRELVERLIPLVQNNQVAIITDERVNRLYSADLKAALTDVGMNAFLVTVPPGERSKNLETAQFIYQRLLDERADRHTLLIAYGGGVIGDLAGFVAATYMRGMPFVQVPTTLLAMVDSSVGGKVGVNLPQGKNLVGTFYEPKFVWTDTAHLSTLRTVDVLSGLCEALKHAILGGESLVTFFEQNGDDLLAGDVSLWRKILPEILKIKADVVEADVRENGLRRILNFGHTLGHALETKGMSAVTSHGVAVGIGMRAMLRMSANESKLDMDVVVRLEHLFDRMGIPKLTEDMLGSDVLALIRTDKKKMGEMQRLVLVEAIGSPIVVEYEWAEVEHKFRALLNHSLMEE